MGIQVLRLVGKRGSQDGQGLCWVMRKGHSGQYLSQSRKKVKRGLIWGLKRTAGVTVRPGQILGRPPGFGNGINVWGEAVKARQVSGPKPSGLEVRTGH